VFIKFYVVKNKLGKEFINLFILEEIEGKDEKRE